MEKQTINPFQLAEKSRYFTFDIFNQMVPTMVLWSWGIHSRKVIDNRYISFAVNGRHFQGRVHVVCNAADTLDVYFTSKNRLPRSNDFKLIHKIEGLYCDQIAEVIDNYVEYVPSYQY
jgi:hypothetical protein